MAPNGSMMEKDEDVTGYIVSCFIFYVHVNPLMADHVILAVIIKKSKLLNYKVDEKYLAFLTDQLEGLLKACGGSVYQHPSKMPQEDGKENFIIAQHDVQEEETDYQGKL